MPGEKPFGGETFQKLMRLMSEELVFDSREPFAKFFDRGLAQKPEKRFSSVSEMKYNLSNSTFNFAE